LFEETSIKLSSGEVIVGIMTFWKKIASIIPTTSTGCKSLILLVGLIEDMIFKTKECEWSFHSRDGICHFQCVVCLTVCDCCKSCGCYGKVVAKP
jgi:two-component SAPR family response regulator